MAFATVALVVLVTPIQTSMLVTAWDRFVGERSSSPLTPLSRQALTAAQGAALVLVLAWPKGGLLMLSALYASLAIGVLYYLRIAGDVSCGCWGQHGGVRLSTRLSIFDSVCSAGCFTLWLERGAVDLPRAEVAVAIALAAMLQFYAFVVLPAWLPIYRFASTRASRYWPWARGFPRLEEALQ